MYSGDESAWAQKLISLDQLFMERVAILWPYCIAAFLHHPREDAITISLVHRLNKDEIVRHLFHYVEYQYGPRRNEVSHF